MSFLRRQESSRYVRTNHDCPNLIFRQQALRTTATNKMSKPRKAGVSQCLCEMISVGHSFSYSTKSFSFPFSFWTAWK